MNKPHIVLVDQDIFLQDMYAHMIGGQYKISTAQDAQGCIDILDSEPVDLVLTDMQLGFNNGIEILHEMRSYDDWLDIPLIVLSSLPKSYYPLSNEAWAHYGVRAFLYKPHIDISALRSAVGQIFSDQKMHSKGS